MLSLMVIQNVLVLTTTLLYFKLAYGEIRMLVFL